MLPPNHWWMKYAHARADAAHGHVSPSAVLLVPFLRRATHAMSGHSHFSSTAHRSPTSTSPLAAVTPQRACNLQAVFNKILNVAVAGALAKDQMVQSVFVLSGTEFDRERRAASVGC